MTEILTEKWEATLNEESAPAIENQEERAVVAQLLENQAQHLLEAAPTNTTANSDNYDRVVMQMVRRGAVKFNAMQFVGTQALTSPTGLIFSLHAEYAPSGNEALFNEADTAHSGTGTQVGTDPFDPLYAAGEAMPTATGETGVFNEMQMKVSKKSVDAKTRQLKATYSLELAQDLKNMHGLSGDDVLSGILIDEINSEIDRELIRQLYITAKTGAQTGVTTAGTVDLATDVDGRWSKENYQSLALHIEKESAQIAKETRRGRGNFVIVSCDVASALSMAGVLDHSGAVATDNYVGMFKSSIKVFVDPFAATGVDFFVCGYKGASSWDAGLYYCPYIPLVRRQAVDPSNMQPVVAFSSRYGVTSNAFITGLTAGQNPYFRKVKLANLL